VGLAELQRAGGWVQNDRTGVRRGFVALEYRSFRLLFLSNVVSGFGGQLQQIANLWQVFALTGSAVHLGLTGLARAIPLILFSLMGGVVADRVDRKKIIVTTQIVNGVLVLVLGLLSASGLVQVWHIYAATFVNASMMAVSAPARRAIISGLVPRQHLVNAMALNSTVNQVDRILAPALAGVMIATVGLGTTYVVNGAAHFITAVALAFIPLGGLPVRVRQSPMRELVEGLSFVRMRSIILVLLATDGAATLFGGYQVVLPIIADQYGLGPQGYGFLAAAPAVGSVFATTAVMYLGDFSYKGRLIVGAILAYCVCLAGLGLAPWFALACLSASGLGFFDSLQAAPRNAAIQLLCPDELRGRVSSFQQMLVSGVPALGLTLMGTATAVVGAPVAMVAGAIACASVITGLISTRPDLRSRDLGTARVPASLEREPPVAVG
jgi:MFS family permease